MITFNNEVAKNLREIAVLLKNQHANYFRYQAYLNAAKTIEELPEDLRSLFEIQGIEGLIHLPTIGVGIAHLIYEYIGTGRMSRLENLQGSPDPLAMLQSIPTIGRLLAKRIRDKLHIDTLFSLEGSLHSGQLDQIQGLGDKRRQAIEDWLYKNVTERNQQLKNYKYEVGKKPKAPSVELLLNLDTEYRNKANVGKLPLITPKRFNLGNKAWLPILHTKKSDWYFTVIYSNTERAHKLDKVYDWVVIFFYNSHHQEGQHTVVTEVRGSLKDLRVVRGREDECHLYYDMLNQEI